MGKVKIKIKEFTKLLSKQEEMKAPKKDLPPGSI